MYEKIKLLSQELEKSQQIQVEKNRIENGIDDFHQSVLKGVNLSLDETLLEFYQSLNGCYIKWQHIEKEEKETNEETNLSIAGEIRIASISDLLFPKLKITQQYQDQFLEDEVEDLQNFRVFDNSDDYMRVGFLIEDGIIKSDLYYVLEDAEGFSELPFSFKEYLELMIQYKGMYYWQYAITMDDQDFKAKAANYIKEIFGK